jgi:hypothetical protein
MKFSIERKKEKKVPRKNTEKRNSVLAEVAHFHFDRSNPDVGYYSIEKISRISSRAAAEEEEHYRRDSNE